MILGRKHPCAALDWNMFPSFMVRFQIPTLISFGLGKYYHLSNFQWPKSFEDVISVMNLYDRFSSTKCKHLANAKLLVVGKLLADDNFLADGKLLVDAKHLVNIKHLPSIKMLTDLTIDEKLVDL